MANSRDYWFAPKGHTVSQVDHRHLEQGAGLLSNIKDVTTSLRCPTRPPWQTRQPP